MAKTVADALYVARRNLGIAEGKSNSNPFAAVAGHANGQPWCATFIAACLAVAGVTKKGSVSAYVPTLKLQFPAVNKADVRPGDIMVMWFPHMNRYAHAGLVEQVFPTYVVTIEGNTNGAGSRTGGQVMRKKRAYKGLAFVRPPYAAPAPPKPAPKRAPADPVLRVGSTGQKVADIQRALLKLGHRLVLDSQFGSATKKAVAAFQRKAGLPVDGVVGPKTWHAIRVAIHGEGYNR